MIYKYSVFKKKVYNLREINVLSINWIGRLFHVIFLLVLRFYCTISVKSSISLKNLFYEKNFEMAEKSKNYQPDFFLFFFVKSNHDVIYKLRWFHGFLSKIRQSKIFHGWYYWPSKFERVLDGDLRIIYVWRSDL